MPDLGILEIVIACFLFLPLTVPYVKSFGKIDGFIWLTPLAFFCTVAIFPAFGFRPECIPLLLFSFVSIVLNRRVILAKISMLSYSYTSERSHFYFLFSFIFMVASVFIAVYFLPVNDSAQSNFDSAFTEKNGETEYYMRLYNSSKNQESKFETGDEPILLVVPPVLGSVGLVDSFSDEIAKYGINVVSFSRKGVDIRSEDENKKAYFPPIIVIKDYIYGYIAGKKDIGANAAARFFEDERKKDIKFILKMIKEEFNANNISILAYNEGASAIILLLQNDDFINDNPNLKSVVAVDADLLSNYKQQILPAAAEDTSSNFIIKEMMLVKNKFFPKKETSVLIFNNVVAPKIPVLLIDRNFQNEVLLSLAKYDTVTSIIGSDYYSDMPEKYPIISALQGLKDVPHISVTAKSIYNFIANNFKADAE
jgi:hypothetical protein